MVAFIHVSPLKPCHHLFSGHLSLFDWSTRIHLVRSTQHEAPRYVVFSTPLLPQLWHHTAALLWDHATGVLTYLKWAPSTGHSRRCESGTARVPPHAGTRRCPSYRSCMSPTWSCTCNQTQCHNVRLQTVLARNFTTRQGRNIRQFASRLSKTNRLHQGLLAPIAAQRHDTVFTNSNNCVNAFNSNPSEHPGVSFTKKLIKWLPRQ